MMAETAEQRITEWLQAYLAALLSLKVEEVDIHMSFSRLGLDSSAGIAMTGELSSWLSCELDPTVVFDHPNIASLAAVLGADSEIQRQLTQQVPADLAVQA